MLQPKRFGGYEFEPITFYKIIVEIARGDPATGWCLALAASHALIVGSHWPEAAQRELFGPDGEFRAPHRTSPTGTATPQDGGYVVSGTWNYVSGIPYATHFIGNALVKTDGKPPQNVIFAAPRERVVMHDDWGGDLTLGMRGSGSYSVTLKDVFIPGHWVLPFTAFFAKADQTDGTPGTRLHANPMYLGQIMGPYHASLVAPIVGAARAALDEFREIITTKHTISPPFVPRHQHYDHQRVMGQALTLTDAAEALLYQSCHGYMDLCRRWQTDGTPDQPRRQFPPMGHFAARRAPRLGGGRADLPQRRLDRGQARPACCSAISATSPCIVATSRRNISTCPRPSGGPISASRSRPSDCDGATMTEVKKTEIAVAGTTVKVMRKGKGAPLLILHGAGGAGVWLPYHGQARRRLRRHRARASGLRRQPTCPSGSITSTTSPISISISLTELDLEGVASGRPVARRLARGRARRAQHQPARLADPGRRGRHLRQGREADRRVPHERRAEASATSSTIRSSPSR